MTENVKVGHKGNIRRMRGVVRHRREKRGQREEHREKKAKREGQREERGGQSEQREERDMNRREREEVRQRFSTSLKYKVYTGNDRKWSGDGEQSCSERPRPWGQSGVVDIFLLVIVLLLSTSVSVVGGQGSAPGGQASAGQAPLTPDCSNPPRRGYTMTASGVVEIRVGVIVIKGYDAPYNVERSGAAIQLAIEHVNANVLNATYRLVKIERHYGPHCDAADAPGIVADLFYNVGIAVLVGPACKFALDPVGRLAGYWNIPVITGLGDSGIFKNKTDYPTLTRMAYCQCRLRRVFGAVFTTFGWHDITLIRSRDDVHASVLGETLDVGLKKQNIYPKIINFYKEDSIEKALKAASDVSRIIILSVSGDQVRSFMLEARRLGYTRGQYVFMDVELFKFEGDYWGNHDWQRGDASDALALDAYNALLRIALYQPNSTRFQRFSMDVKNRSQIMYNFTYGDEKVNFFVGAFYDAVVHYGEALNETLTAGKDFLDGRTVARQMWNRSFTGITEEVQMDDNGDRDTSYSILDLNKDTGEFKVVANYWGSNPGYSAVDGVEIYWGEEISHPPPNTPPCWFRNDNPTCLVKEAFSPAMIGIICALCVVILGGIIAFLGYRRYQLEAELRDTSWILDGEAVKNRKTTYMSSMVAMSVVSSKSHETSNKSQVMTISSGAGGQVYTDTAIYKGQQIALRQLKKKQVTMNRNLLIEVKNRRVLTHENIVKFIGAIIDPPKIVIAHEYCSKGSLQDLLANESISLDHVFKMSLIEDIVKGMTFLHNTASIGVHGRLRSSNCVVDNRFVLKLTDFGLPTFYCDEDIDQSQDEFIYYTKLLWTAPEILRSARHEVKYTPKSDVYSFGIILEEIIMRGGPYDTVRGIMEPKDIVEKVREGGERPLRPTVPKDQCSPALRSLMQRCMMEDPGDRPDFTTIKHNCRKMTGGKETNLLDNLLQRMEQYANNLESIVGERTSMLIQEQKKTEQLLLQILPRTIMEALKSGKTVDPEWFDEVSIYFSDIVGFTTISAGSTPIQVVNMLNDLYTTFDAVIEKFDVYKVETIGDAYMVASGLPIRNGNQHGREVARMSLAVLSSISEFRIRHLPTQCLKLRIGLHSGPVCAGVVGHKMPRYCLFGDTVNTASRMESNSLPLKIHISETTQSILQSYGMFETELRGDLEIKGKGTMRTYWLTGERGTK